MVKLCNKLFSWLYLIEWMGPVFLLIPKNSNEYQYLKCTAISISILNVEKYWGIHYQSPLINGKADKHLPYPNFETAVKFLLGKQSFIKFFLGKQSFYKVFRKDSYHRLKFDIFAWLSLNLYYGHAFIKKEISI